MFYQRITRLVGSSFLCSFSRSPLMRRLTYLTRYTRRRGGCSCIENTYKLHRARKWQRGAMYQTLSRPALNLWLIIFSGCNLFPLARISRPSYASISLVPRWQLVRTIRPVVLVFARLRPTSSTALKSLPVPELSRYREKVDRDHAAYARNRFNNGGMMTRPVFRGRERERESRVSVFGQSGHSWRVRKYVCQCMDIFFCSF